MDLQIGRVLTAILKERKISLRELSKATSVSVSTLSDWSSNRNPNPSKLKLVAEHLGVSIHYLLFGIEDNQNALEKILKEEFFSGTFEISVKRVKLPKERK